MNPLAQPGAVDGNDLSERRQARVLGGGARPQENPSFAVAAEGPDLYRWGQLLSSTLVRLRAKFDGDFDQYLILMVFVLTDLYRTCAAPARPAPKARGINVLSLADLTEIPRETVRRKLRALTDCGYLVRGQDQLYYLSDRYEPDEFLLDLMPLFKRRPPRAESAASPALG